MIKILNLKLMILLEYQNIKIFLQKVTLTSNWSEEVFVIKKVKNMPWTYFINDLNGDEIVGVFYEKGLQKKNRRELRIEKVIKREGDKLGHNQLIVWFASVLPQKIWKQKSSDFLKKRTIYCQSVT